MKLFFKVLLGSIVSFIGYFVGWLIGATLAGNYAVSLKFADQVGYEAGGLIVGVAGAILASTVFVWELERKVRRTPLFFGAFLGGVGTCILVWKFSADMLIPLVIAMVLPALGAIAADEIVRSRSKTDST
jgi:hypothetical protein